MRFTVSVSKRIYAGDKILGEVFFSKEFDDSVVPAEAAFQAVREQAEKWAGELAEKWSGSVESNLTQQERRLKSRKPDVRNVQDVAEAFPKDLISEISIEDGGENIIVKPNRYLGTDKFRKIADVIRGTFEGGVYISAGRDSHWRIPKTKTEPPKTIGFIDEQQKRLEV